MVPQTALEFTFGGCPFRTLVPFGLASTHFCSRWHLGTWFWAGPWVKECVLHKHTRNQLRFLIQEEWDQSMLFFSHLFASMWFSKAFLQQTRIDPLSLARSVPGVWDTKETETLLPLWVLPAQCGRLTRPPAILMQHLWGFRITPAAAWTENFI